MPSYNNWNRYHNSLWNIHKQSAESVDMCDVGTFSPESQEIPNCKRLQFNGEDPFMGSIDDYMASMTDKCDKDNMMDDMNTYASTPSYYSPTKKARTDSNHITPLTRTGFDFIPSETVGFCSDVRDCQLKHVYKTISGTYRVQISRGCKSNPNKKFSRNARVEEDALWLCECALILIDQPGTFKDLLRNSNYYYLVDKQIVMSAEDFIQKLVENMRDLSARGLLSMVEAERLAPLLQTLVSGTSVGASNSFRRLDRPNFSLATLYYDDDIKETSGQQYFHSFTRGRSPTSGSDFPRSPCQEWQDVVQTTTLAIRPKSPELSKKAENVESVSLASTTHQTCVQQAAMSYL
mmetsp:Transcript_10866/g.16548  ORF Transcript_10866/g.16548 Transcript_10866/m.16548 type:complete len:349 (-) Transcript_10866:427-1473(-)